MAAKSTTSSCKQCAQLFVRGDNCIACDGFCSNAYHIECVQYSFEELLWYRKLKNVWWICGDCRSSMKETKNCRSTTDAEKASDSHTPSSCSKFDQLEKEIVALKAQMTEIHQTLTDGSSVHSPRIPDAAKIANPLAQSSVLSSSQLMRGTKTAGNRTRIRTDNGVPGRKYWLFLTKIKNSVSERDIHKLINDCLGTDDAVVRKLVPAWRDASSLPFISFKVGIGVEFKELAESPSTWPAGLCFREFQEYVWEPLQYDQSCLS